MLIQLPALWLVVVNVAAWLAIHLGVAWVGTKLPEHLFRPGDAWFRPRPWERRGLYERAFRIRAWKDLLPDGAALFRKGFRKKRLMSRDPEYLERFARETCRGEAVHWVVLGSSPFFFLWNPWWAGLIMVAYGMVANVPCILAQRYNRLRLMRRTRFPAAA